MRRGVGAAAVSPPPSPPGACGTPGLGDEEMKERIPAATAPWEAEGTETELYGTDEEMQGGLTALENEAEEGRRHLSPAAYDKARQLMMEANIRLVMSIARRYTCRSMAFEDLVQEGIIGLLEAINKFDVSRGNRVSTYATYCIRQAIF